MALVSLINADRLWTRLMALAEIGGTPAGGVNRQALSDAEIAAWRRVIGWAREAGLTTATDAAGNLLLTLAGRDRVAPPLLPLPGRRQHVEYESAEPAHVAAGASSLAQVLRDLAFTE